MPLSIVNHNRARRSTIFDFDLYNSNVQEVGTPESVESTSRGGIGGESNGIA